MINSKLGLIMKLTPREKDKLMISVAANVARKRLERGASLIIQKL